MRYRAEGGWGQGRKAGQGSMQVGDTEGPAGLIEQVDVVRGHREQAGVDSCVDKPRDREQNGWWQKIRNP